MQQTGLTIQSNRQLAPHIWEMILSGDTGAVTAPGQFIDVKLDGFTLRRPISICDWDAGHITLIYKELGKGTAAMTQLLPGKTLNVLTGLGNGYDLSKSGAAPLLVGGGVGIPPLYGLAKRLVQNGKSVQAVLGFNSGDEIFYAEQFKALGVRTVLTTADGSVGVRGFVTDGMATAGEYSYLYTCGPEAMLRAVYQACRTSGQFSFEERMGCGFGVCMGCSCQTKYGSKRICKDGPVLEKEEIVW
jgi:dihydroorotate dehydrogenase electron transfer subunit